jgi:hypothetical protein
VHSMAPLVNATAVAKVATNTLTNERIKVLASARIALIVQLHAVVVHQTAVLPGRRFNHSKPP